MTTEKFNEVIDEQLNTCKNILCKKAAEYATEDRLHNFKCAGGLMECNPKEALMGMMVKHTVSVSDMCRSGLNYPLDLWNEKITDSINYLLLLKALVVEEKEEIIASRPMGSYISGEAYVPQGVYNSQMDDVILKKET